MSHPKLAMIEKLVDSNAEISILGETRTLVSNLCVDDIECLAHEGLLMNDSIDRIPDSSVFLSIMGQYPFFRADIEFYSLPNGDGIAYIVGLHNDGSVRGRRAQFDEEARCHIQETLANTFHTADEFLMESGCYSVRYHITKDHIAAFC